MAKPKRSNQPRRKNENVEKTPQALGKRSFHFEFKTTAQKIAWSTIEQHDLTFLLGSPGTGKTFLACAYAVQEVLAKRKSRIVLTRPILEAAGSSMGFLPGPQPLDAKVVTPNGWTTMGKLKIGDRVIGRDGMPTEVIGIYPKGKKDTYKITTSDGTSTVCCLDHLWHTKTKEEKSKNQQGKVRLTKDIISDLDKGIKHFLPRNEPVHFEKNNLPIPPYVLGVLLGDGYSGKTHVRFASADNEIADRVNKEIECLGLYCNKAKKQYNNNKAWTYTLSSTNENWEGCQPVKITNIETNESLYFPTNKKALEFVGCKKKTLATRVFYKATVDGKKYEKYGECWTNPVLKYLKDSELHEKKAWEKFIPNEYKYSSVQDRINILRGLLDTDGSCRARNKDQVTFYTTSYRLAEDVAEIVGSLGGRCRLSARDRRNDKIKNNIIARRISYELVIFMPKYINPFYLGRKANRFTGSNLSYLEIKSIEKIGFEEVQCIKVDNPEHLYLTDNFIVTHNTIDEKTFPYMVPMYDCLDIVLGKHTVQREIINKAIEISPIAYLRGRTFTDAICIFDEAQNATFAQLKLYLTRFGDNSKVIVTGDPNQCDLNCKIPPLVDIMKKLEDVSGIGTIEFKNSSIIRHPLVQAILEKLEK